MKKSQQIKKFLHKTVPLWMVALIVLDSILATGIIQYYVMKKQFNQQLAQLSKTTKNPQELVQIITQEVLPSYGYKTSLKWKDLGKQLVEAGAIDKKKYAEIFASNANGGYEMKYLDNYSNENITINEKNSRFIVNTFWALGLINKSKVLDEGPMRANGTETGNFASTGGWTLGEKTAMELYSSKEIIPLTQKQQELVKKIADNVYRPCCGNPTSFPDCNHGMAALGYIELAVKNGLSEKQIYKDLLAFNSFWFPTTYIEIAAYFSKAGIKWKDVDAKLALSSNYSSAQGARRINQSVQDVPGIKSQGGSCGA
ncbi:MAG: hypothetical protein HYT83_03970 [Candidatus Levybacteria bacterium]|nr:hypothetical protein [Candidatus Levybacteria bacterium]